MLFALSSWILNLAAIATDEENKKNPKTAELSYFATVKTEIAPEYGQVYFAYSVRCQPTPEAATKAISDLSSKVWNTIVTKMGKTGKFTETERSFWSPINTSESEGSRLQYVNPVVKDGVVVTKGYTQNINLCTQKEISLTEKLVPTYTATQKIGVRTNNLDWLESMVLAAQKVKQENKVDSVRTHVSAIQYGITEATKVNAYNKLLSDAQERATGKNSQFESDAKTLKFDTAHFIGVRASRAPVYNPIVGSAISRGTASKVELRVPFTYKIYAESTDKLKKIKTTEPVNNSYEIEGVANANADFATMSVGVSSTCHTSKEDAIKAIRKVSEDILNELQKLNNKQSTETNALVIETLSVGESDVGVPVEWNNDPKNMRVTAVLDTCTGNKVAVKEDGKKPTYSYAEQVYTIRTSNFNAGLDLREALVKTYYTPSRDTKKVAVSATELTADVTKATKDALIAQARLYATSCILDPNGPVAKDAALHGFSCAHLSDLRMGRDRTQNSPFDRSDSGFAAPSAGRAMAKEADSGPQEDTLNVEFVKKDNEQRPKAPIERTFEFRYRVLSENYVPKKSE